MANRRDIKKYVRHTCGSIAGECILANALVPGIDTEKINHCIVETADLQEATLALLSLSFDKAPRDFDSLKEYRRARSAYYKKAFGKLLASFDERLNEIVGRMNEALPAAQREINKKAAEA